MRANEFGTNPKRPSRNGSRPARGHEPQPRYRTSTDNTTDESFADPELRQAKTDATQHYSGYSPEVAFQKWVQRSLMHSKQDDERLNQRVDDLEAEIHQLKSVRANEDLDEVVLKQAQTAANPFPKSTGAIDMSAWSKLAKQLLDKGMSEDEIVKLFVSKGLPQRLAVEAVQGAQLEEGKDPCWKGYKQIGMKKKNNKEVPNCVPANESWEEIDEWLIQERGKASRRLCQSGIPDKDLGASQLASCKSQGLRARDGEKSHLIGHGGAKVRVTVGGKKIKGKKYGGPLPDYGTRKDQR